jgi:hypothetical protein
MKISALFVLAALLGGCAGYQQPPASAGSEASGPTVLVPTLWRSEAEIEAEEVIYLLVYFQRVQAMSAEEQRREYALVSQQYGRDKSENSRLKLAMLMSIPGASFRDDAKLSSLLETTSGRNGDSPRRALVTLLARLQSERLRQTGQLRDELKKSDTQLKEEQRRSEETLKRADEQQKRADELQKRADELQQKLDKLLAIDREMRSRGSGRTPGH